MVGSNRIVPGKKIVNPMGDQDLSPPEEKKLRRSIAQKALQALQSNIDEQTTWS
jgi:glycine reductase complex component B subunit gamma